MNKYQEFRVSYKPDDDNAVKICEKAPMDAAYQFFKNNPKNKIVQVEKSMFDGTEFHPSEFVDKYEDAEQIILANCPDAMKPVGKLSVGVGHLGSASSGPTRIGSAFSESKGKDFSSWKLSKGDKAFYIVAFIVTVLGTILFLYFNDMLN